MKARVVQWGLVFVSARFGRCRFVFVEQVFSLILCDLQPWQIDRIDSEAICLS